MTTANKIDLSSSSLRAGLIENLYLMRAHTAVVDRAICAAIRFIDANDPDAGERLKALAGEHNTQSEMWREIEEMLDMNH